MLNRREFLKTTGLGFTLLTCSYCQGINNPLKKKPNILLIVSEDNGPELGWYGDPYVKTPSLLKQAGYRTGIIGKLHVNPESAFPFDFRAIPGANFGKGQRDMTKYADKAEEFFNAFDEPFFLSINYPDAHFPLHRQDHGLPEKPLEAKDVKPFPWVGADSPRLREFTANYYNCLSRLDTGIGMLLEN